MDGVDRRVAAASGQAVAAILAVAAPRGDGDVDTTETTFQAPLGE